MTVPERYARQVRQWGEIKQLRLEKATILVAGIGGLGATVSQLLVRAGVGKLYLVDDGQVDWPDLNRQTIYTEKDIGQAKVDCACRYLQQINSSVDVQAIETRIGPSFQIPDDVTFVADCLDNYTSRFDLEAALATGTFLVHGGLEGAQGQVLTIKKGHSQPLFELFAGSCQPKGDIPATGANAAIIAGLMTNELCRVVFGQPNLLDRCLIVGLDDLHFSFLEV